MRRSSKELQLPEFWERADACSQSETHIIIAVNCGLAGGDATTQCMLGILTETCPERKLGLMGDVMEMEGPTFCESKELEPEEQVYILN